MHPFINAKELSDEELTTKVGQLVQKITYARAAIGDVSMINSLNAILETFQMELQERYARQSFDMWNKQFPDVIESDPDFKKEGKDGKGVVAGESKPAFSKKFGRGQHLDITPVPVVKEEPKKKS